MGAWGAGLFESDQDLEVAGDISDDAGMELIHPEKEEMGGKGLEVTVKALDKGLFDRLFSKYKNSATDYEFYGAKYYLVILMALGMKLGVMVSEEQKSYARSIVKSAGLYKEGITQFEQALDKCVSGQPYKFVSPDVCETLPTRPGGVQLMNHLAPRYHADNIPTQDMALRMIDVLQNGHKCDGCGKHEKSLGESQKFKRCTRCKTAQYCNRDCQKRGWKAHKKICGLQANRTAETAETAARNANANSAEGFPPPAGAATTTATARSMTASIESIFRSRFA